MIFCPHCQAPVPDGSLACRECQTPINVGEVIAGSLKASQGAEYVVGGINWWAVVFGAFLALGIWNGGMYGLMLLFGSDAVWFSIMVKVTAIAVGSFVAGYRSYSAELTHGLLVAAIVAAINGTLVYAVYRIPFTFELVLIDFVFIDFGTAIFAAFLGAKCQR
jgi:hypothetical protein